MPVQTAFGRSTPLRPYYAPLPEPEALGTDVDAELVEALRQGIEETIARPRELLERLERGSP